MHCSNKTLNQNWILAYHMNHRFIMNQKIHCKIFFNFRFNSKIRIELVESWSSSPMMNCTILKIIWCELLIKSFFTLTMSIYVFKLFITCLRFTPSRKYWKGKYLAQPLRSVQNKHVVTYCCIENPWNLWDVSNCSSDNNIRICYRRKLSKHCWY